MLLVAVLFSFASCEEVLNYPIYSLKTVTYIPDSLKIEHRKWITETVRAANQQLSAGDYEDIDQTIIQAERTAENIFSVKLIGLRKQINDNHWEDLELKPNELNSQQKKVLDSLQNSH